MPDSLSFDRYSEQVRRFFDLPINFAPVRPSKNDFYGKALVRTLSSLTVARFSGEAHSAQHPKNFDGEGVLALNLLLRGEGYFEEGKMFGRLRPMMFAITDSARGVSWRFTNDFDEFVLRIPLSSLPFGSKYIDRVRGRVLPPGLHSEYLAKFLAGVAQMPKEVVPAVVSGTEAAVIGLLDGALMEAVRGISPDQPASREVLRNLILDDMRASLGNPNFSPGDAAAKHNISVRLLHQLFSDEEKTFMETLREMRLQRARELLTRRNCSVTEIAQETGFARLETFSRQFRSRFGLSPKTYRESSLCEGKSGLGVYDATALSSGAIAGVAARIYAEKH